MRRPLVIYDFAPDPIWISLNIRKVLFSFLSVSSDIKNFWSSSKMRSVLFIWALNKVFWLHVFLILGLYFLLVSIQLHPVLIHKALNYVYTSDGFGVKVNRDISWPVAVYSCLAICWGTLRWVWTNVCCTVRTLYSPPETGSFEYVSYRELEVRELEVESQLGSGIRGSVLLEVRKLEVLES